MRNDSKPDHEFDAYLKRQGSPDVLCDMQVLLPRDASEDMRISLFAPGTQDVDSVFSQDTMMLKSETYKKLPTFEVIATGVHLKQVYAQLDKDSVRLAIVALHPLTELSAQRDYLAMFAALEGLSKLHKDKMASELDAVWAGIQSSLSECINKQTSIGLDVHDFLKNNLSALKQGKKLEVRMKEFLKSLNVYLDDLWPIFGDAKHPSLYWTRNELAHGQHFNGGRFGTFLRAEEHLRLTLERIVLCVLGFDPSRSTAGIQSLHNQGRRLTSTQLKDFQAQLLQQ